MAKRTGSLFRVLLLAVAGLALMQAYLTRGIIGGGDATWYATAVGDYLAQVRAGVFPVWVGQTRYLFFGGIFPLRFAPLLEHQAALIDLLTGRRFPLFVVLNCTLAASLVGGILSCYFCVARVIPRCPWQAAALAFLYASCPGVLAIAYTQDLYMSFTTLPFLPVVFLGMVRSFERNDLVSRLLMAGGLAATWLAHPPIAIACGAVAVASQVVRLWRQPWSRSTFLLDCAAIGMFLLLGGYTFVSAAYIPRPAADADLGALFAQVSGAFPDNWRPLPRPIPLNNLQMGYGLAALFLCALAASIRRGGPLARTYVACGVLLLVAVVPVPLLNHLVWHLVPATVFNIINVWPMQRLLVVLALCTIFATALVFRGDDRARAHSRWMGWILLLPAVAWSGSQARTLVVRASRASLSPAEYAVTERPENLKVTNMFISVAVKARAPRYASGGVMDPELESRLIDRATMELIGDNVDAVAPGYGPGPRVPTPPAPLGGLFTGKLDANPGILDVLPSLTLAPGKRYLLVIGFFDRDYSGTLLIQGTNFFRQYNLPMSGERRAFGSAPESSRAIPIWTSSAEPVDVQLRYIPSSGAPTLSFSPFARYELREFTSDELPIRLESLLPYRVRVRTDAAAYLETPRLIIPGYRATVDGRDAPVRASPDHYVAVPIDPGVHEVTVIFVPPLPVLAAYWVCAAAWMGFAALLSWRIKVAKAAQNPANLSLV